MSGRLPVPRSHGSECKIKFKKPKLAGRGQRQLGHERQGNINHCATKNRSDAESSGAQASTPGGEERYASDPQSRAQKLKENDDDMTVKFMQQTSKITESVTIAEGDTRTMVQNRAPARAYDRNMVQSIASATKMAKQSLWGQSPTIWNVDEAADGDETLVRKLEEQLNAAKQRLSLVGSTTSGAKMNPNVQRRASGGASEDVPEHARCRRGRSAMGPAATAARRRGREMAA